MRYTPVAMPPQQATTLFLCGECSALVSDTEVHTASHSPRRATVAPREYAQPAVRGEYPPDPEVPTP